VSAARTGLALGPDADSAIRQLVAAYAVAVLVHDTGLWLSLWAPSDRPATDPLTLDLQWARRVSERWESLGTTVLHVTTHRIEPLTAKFARGTVFCIAELDRPGQPFVQQSLVYDDRYALTDGEWRFSSRRHLLWYGREVANPRCEPPACWPAAQVGRGVELSDELAAGQQLAGGRHG
jgi:SnoaL-like protein